MCSHGKGGGGKAVIISGTLSFALLVNCIFFTSCCALRCGHSFLSRAGPPGIGKTTTALLACREAGLLPIEFNASDTRSKGALRPGLAAALRAAHGQRNRAAGALSFFCCAVLCCAL